jgi:FAD/FMN-containing dehydrogenase
MTHAVDGYSLALDFKVTARNRRRLWEHAAELTRVVLDAGGRFYFAKDSTLTAPQLERYLAEERVRRFLALKRTLDPEGLLQTDLYRRLFAGAAEAARATPYAAARVG